MKPTYAQRNTLLLRMGFTSYDNYLAGVLWAEIRDAVVNRDSHTCKLCDNKSEVVHHIDYEEATMRGESLDGLVSVCCRCHKNIEFSKKGEKRSLLSAQYAYRNLMGCKLGLKKKSKQKHTKKRSSKPRCACGNFRRHNRLKCRICEPNGKIVTRHSNRPMKVSI